MSFYCFHSDLSNPQLFAWQSQIKQFAESVGHQCHFANSPRSWWLRGWRKSDTAYVIEWYDRVSKGDHSPKYALGNSDGGTMAASLATLRPEFEAIWSYAGRIWHLPAMSTGAKLLSFFNGRDRRYSNTQHLDLIHSFRDSGHEVESRQLDNKWSHWGGWDSRFNPWMWELVE